MFPVAQASIPALEGIGLCMCRGSTSNARAQSRHRGNNVHQVVPTCMRPCEGGPGGLSSSMQRLYSPGGSSLHRPGGRAGPRRLQWLPGGEPSPLVGSWVVPKGRTLLPLSTGVQVTEALFLIKVRACIDRVDWPVLVCHPACRDPIPRGRFGLA